MNVATHLIAAIIGGVVGVLAMAMMVVGDDDD